MTGKRMIGAAALTALVVATFSAGALWSHKGPGTYNPNRSWATPRFDPLFAVADAEAASYVKAEPHCVPGMGFHYMKPEEAEAWIAAVAAPVVGLIVVVPMHYVERSTYDHVTHLGPIYLATLVFLIGAVVAIPGLSATGSPSDAGRAPNRTQ